MEYVNQRWNSGRASYRPAGETINPRAFEVEALESDAIARAFVEAPQPFPKARIA